MKKLIAALVFMSSFAFAQKAGVFVLDSIPKKVDQEWRFNKGDNMAWAHPAFNDSLWQQSVSNFSLAKLPKGSFENIAWFRMRI